MRRRQLIFSAVLVLLLAACSSGHRAAAPPTAAATTPATTADAPPGPNPDVIPPVITPAYVDAVFNVLEHIDGNASRQLIAARAITPGALADIRSIYNDSLYAQEVEIAHQNLQGDLSNVRRPPGDVRVTVRSLLSGSARCIFVEVSSDYSEVVTSPPPPQASEYWGLQPKQKDSDPGHINPTPWAFFFNRTFSTPTQIPNQCTSA
jgi:hypothetical protein